jgi:hypothetical protein
MVALVVAVALLAACSNGDDDGAGSTFTTAKTPGTTVDPNWDAAASATAKALAAKVSAALPDQCDDLAPVPRADYAQTAAKVKLDLPLAAFDCTTNGEVIEFSVLADAAKRAAWVNQRTDRLCDRAKDGKFELPGLHFTTGGAWAVQPDTEGLGRRLATILGGKYEVKSCPGVTQVDWEPDAVAHVEAIAKQLATDDRIQCTGFQLVDRVQLTHNPAYANRLPAAFGKCTGPGGASIWIAAFSAKSAQRDPFIDGETRYVCGSLTNVQAVQGTDWAIVATQPQIAARAAVVAGGTALPLAC